MRLLAACAVVAVVFCVAQVSGMEKQLESYDDLARKSDVILIISRDDSKNVPATDPEQDARLVRVHSTLSVLATLKGTVNDRQITFVHYCSIDGKPVEGASLANLQAPKKGQNPGAIDQFLVFLKRHADGTYEATSGQYDSAESVRLLTPNNSASGAHSRTETPNTES